MKKMILAAALTVAASFGAPMDCVSGTLASYIALGDGGCRVGAVVVSGFAETSISLFATAIDASSIRIDPTAGGNFGALRFSASIDAIGSDFFESSFLYNVRRGVVRSSLELDGVAASGTGAVTAILELDFLPQIVFQVDGDQELFASTGIGGYSTLPIRQTLSIDAGPAGSASFGAATASYTVPEPSSILLSLTGAALVWVGRHRFRR